MSENKYMERLCLSCDGCTSIYFGEWVLCNIEVSVVNKGASSSSQ